MAVAVTTDGIYAATQLHTIQFTLRINMVVIQVCVQLPMPANIVTLLAFAAERREAVQMLIDISYLLSSQQQTRHSQTVRNVLHSLLV